MFIIIFETFLTTYFKLISTLSQKIPDVIDCNLNKDYQILIILASAVSSRSRVSRVKLYNTLSQLHFLCFVSSDFVRPRKAQKTDNRCRTSEIDLESRLFMHRCSDVWYAT